MTQVPQSLDTTGISPQQSPEALTHYISPSSREATSADLASATGVRAALLQMPLPSWATVADYATKCFINSHGLYDDLIKSLAVIESTFDRKCQATISFREEQVDQNQKYVSVAIRPSKAQEDTMADRLFKCNQQLASSLSFHTLPFIVLTIG